MQMRSKAAHLSGHIVVAKARELADELGIEDFVGSQGWLHGFKMRHSIKYWNLHGEASAADNSGVTFAQERLPQFIEERVSDSSNSSCIIQIFLMKSNC